MSLNKNRLFLFAVVCILGLAILAYIGVPPLLSWAVERAFRSDAALWQKVMARRNVLGLEAYQAKALELFRRGMAIALTTALTLAWMFWDHKQPRFSAQALAWPRWNTQMLVVLGSGALALLSVRGILAYMLPLFVGLLTLFSRESWQPFRQFDCLLDRLLQRRVSIPLVLLLGAASFLVKFPPKDFDALVFFDDYPTIYSVTLKGWETLKQGGIFGWDPKLMGGYHMVSDVSHNEIFFMFPFLPFGMRVGFHLMLMFFYLAFPFLLYWYARLLFAEERVAHLALWIGLFTAFGFFDNLLYWGMVNSFLGLCFLLLNLILFTLMRDGKRWAAFLLMLSLSLTLYAAVGFFVYSLLLLGIEFLRHFRRQLVLPTALVGIAAFLVTLTFTYPFLRFPGYSVQSDEIYNPPHYTLAEIVAQSLKALPEQLKARLWLVGRPVRYQGAFIVSIPILLALLYRDFADARGMLALRRPASGIVLMAAVVMLATLVVSPSVDMFVSRIRFVLAALLALAYAAWLGKQGEPHPAPFALVAVILLALLPSRLWQPLPHVESLRAYNGPLLEAVESLDSDLILLESMGGYNLATEGEGSTQVQETHAHLEAYFPLETSKSFLANNQEGYHHSIYRRNFITSGAFRGKLLPDWPMDELKAFLEQWGVKHLVLWTEIAKSYFGANASFRLLWSDGFWAIYEYAGAKPGAVVASVGGGEIEVRNYFEQVVKLNGARGGEPVTLRMNYYPAWRGYYDGQEIKLKENQGQLAFLAPADGTYEVTLRYPRYTGLSALALATISAFALLSWRFPRLVTVPCEVRR